MRKLFILFAFLTLVGQAFGQRIRNVQAHAISYVTQSSTPVASARTSAIGDTFTLKHITVTDTLELYSVGNDSGYVTGTDYWGDKAFAERYDFAGSDTSMRVIGVVALFGGTVSPLSTDVATFDVWSVGDQQPVSGSYYYSGFPQTIITSQSFPVTQLGIGAIDTLKQFMFGTPTNFLSQSFFVGYNISYSFDTTGKTTTGNDFGLSSSKNGERNSVAYIVNTTLGDTMINVQNATLGSDNAWYDNLTQNDGLFNNLAIYPVVVIGSSTAGVSSVTRNKLTFYGNYPNPADAVTTIKFALKDNEDVTITVTDMSGRTVQTIQQPGLAPGEHTVNLSTAEMPSGSYLYLIRTAGGDGMAGKLIVAHK